MKELTKEQIEQIEKEAEDFANRNTGMSGDGLTVYEKTECKIAYTAAATKYLLQSIEYEEKAKNFEQLCDSMQQTNEAMAKRMIKQRQEIIKLEQLLTNK